MYLMQVSVARLMPFIPFFSFFFLFSIYDHKLKDDIKVCCLETEARAFSIYD